MRGNSPTKAVEERSTLRLCAATLYIASCRKCSNPCGRKAFQIAQRSICPRPLKTALLHPAIIRPSKPARAFRCQACSSVTFQNCSFERVGPGVAKYFNGTVDHRAPLMFDAE